MSKMNGLHDDETLTSRYVVDLREIDRSDTAIAGGKGANLGELVHIDGVRVPAGFCVTTDAFRRVVAEAPIADRIEQLARLQPDDHRPIQVLSADIRRSIGGSAIPDDLATGIAHALAEHTTYAVRSSATAEDLPTASFAGQHDTYLNVSGLSAILHHVKRCWASLFSERAVVYRNNNGVDPRKVRMAVVVQQMVLPRASGILFTADPVTGNRKVVSIDAAFGLGEALVSGRVNGDVYKVRDGAIVERTVATEPAVTDAEIERLALLGRRIEAHFGCPQDIEWCLAGDGFHIVQSRPITTLFPVPIADDGENHVYVSVGHQQMMTDAMKPLGISIWQLTAVRGMHEAGGRIFVDVTQLMASASGRAGAIALLGKSDPLIGDALQTIIDRGDFVLPEKDAPPAPASKPAPLPTDPAIVAELIEKGRSSTAKLKREIETHSGPALFDFILADSQERKRVLFDPRSYQALMAGIDAAAWLNEHVEAWLGEKNAADTLAQSVPNNITSEMGLDLLHVADVIRAHAAVVEFLRHVDDENFVDELPRFAGGKEARDAIRTWLDKYGMRCVGEIDITRPRWSERPSTLVPLILGNVRNFAPGEGERRFAQGLEAASNKEAELLDRLRALPDGNRKAEEVKSTIDRLRTFVGYRECPKYFMVDRFFAYKRALLKEADRLVQANVLRDREDIDWLTFHELHDVVRTNEVDHQLIRDRKDAFATHQKLSPPRVLTSDGEMLSGAYRRGGVPAGALIGLAVSAGTVEGRARVVFDPAKADIEPGDILVTPYTDPSWTPLFVAIKALVTEVGGLMTHGAVVAREYGLPAVVGVEHATRRIRDGQRIRVHGTDGYVELMPPVSPPSTC